MRGGLVALCSRYVCCAAVPKFRLSTTLQLVLARRDISVLGLTGLMTISQIRDSSNLEEQAPVYKSPVTGCPRYIPRHRVPDSQVYCRGTPTRLQVGVRPTDCLNESRLLVGETINLPCGSSSAIPSRGNTILEPTIQGSGIIQHISRTQFHYQLTTYGNQCIIVIRHCIHNQLSL